MSIQQRARLRHQDEIRGIAFDAGVMQWLVDRSLGAEHVMAYRLTINPGASASHAHPGAEEVVYVIEGTGEIQVEDARHLVDAGKAVFIPDGAEHSHVNTGTTPFVMVGAMAPPIDPATIRPAAPHRAGAMAPATRDKVDVQPTRMDEREIAPTLMGERSFRVMVSPAVGCQRMTQFTGVIPTGRAPLHAHPHEEAVYVLAGQGRLWIEDEAVGELRPGSVVFFPIGVRHTLENVGREDMKVLGAFSPAGSPEAKLPPA
ncbi:MAG TPA: cupin domain-containing protein [Candidatus Dormibacteraeota bacterium]